MSSLFEKVCSLFSNMAVLFEKVITLFKNLL